MTKIDIYSGFLGAGKTTLIKKMILDGYKGQKIVLIENEFGEIGIDGGFLKDAGIKITEMNSGCICCSLVGDFGRALEQVISEYHPDRVLIEPSGVGKLSDVIAAVQKVLSPEVQLGYTVALADAGKVKIYMKNFGEFYNNQIETATTIILSRTDIVSQEKIDKAVALIREKNPKATLITTPVEQLTGEQLIEAMEGNASLAADLAALVSEHEHHHEHDEHCTCGCHDHEHEHHHHHHADEVFTSWGVETTRKFTQEEIRHALEELDSGKYGMILRAKGIVPAVDGSWIHFDHVPGEADIRTGGASVIGRLCVIGSKLNEAGVAQLMGV